MIRPIALALLFFASVLHTLAAALISPGDEVVDPPGLVRIRGGKTQVGADADELIPIIERTGFRKLAGETPRHEVRLDDFHLMVTEVTNEQYLAFVQAAGAKPPRSWAEPAINAEIDRFTGEQGELRKKAQEEGRPFEPQKFDAERQARWWTDNWQSQTWTLPPGEEDRPVVWIAYEEALAYARWAGLRLMTEQEFQRAGRGDSDRAYVWGDTLDLERCATVERKFQSSSPVGSFPGGATADGLFDLCGNVWEWTSSKYSAYPGHKPIQVEIGGRKEPALAEFDANLRVVVSGCFKSPGEAARLTTRRASERFQSTDSLGFRCAATPTAGRDLAQAIVERELSVYVLPEGTSFDPQLTVAMDRWESRSGTAAVERYQIITAYHHVLFTPVASIDAGGVKPLAERSIETGPILVGLLSTSVAIEEPALSPGTYLVLWRGMGEKDEQPPARGAEVVEAAAPPLWKPTEDSFVFHDLAGLPVSAMRAEPIKNEHLKAGAIEAVVMQPSEEQKEYGKLPWDEIDLSIPIPGQKSSTRGFVLELSLVLPEGAVTGHAWRRTGP